MTSSSSCTFALPNCVHRDPKPKSPPEGDAIVARLRAVVDCEPKCPEWIMVRGRITPETPRQLAAVMDTLGKDERVPIILDSTGGDLDAAIEMGRMIRARTFTTAVAGNLLIDCDPQEELCSRGRSPAEPYRADLNSIARCDAECLFVLVGGTKRVTNWLVYADLPHIASFTTKQKGVTPSVLIGRYLDDMSISPRLTEMSIAADGKPIRLLRKDIRIYRLGNLFKIAPDFLSDPARCKRSEVPQNCILRADNDN